MKIRESKSTRFLIGIAAGAFLATVAVLACDKEAPKSGTTFCDQNLDTCSSSTPVLVNGVQTCANKNIVNMFPSGCKGVETDTNCTEEQANCSATVNCNPNDGYTACVTGMSYGTWDQKPKKISQSCTNK